MTGWKKALVGGSLGVGAVMFMTRRPGAGVLAAGLGLAVLASEYPEKFEEIQQALPDYFERGMRMMETAAKVGQRMTAMGQASGGWSAIRG